MPSRIVCLLALFAHPLFCAVHHPQLPLFFERRGTGAVGRLPGYSVHLDSCAASMTFAGEAPVRLRFPGAACGRTAEGIEPLASYSNYFTENDSAGWRTRVPHYGKVRFRDVYPGIDAVYYGNERNLEYDLIVAPGVDPSAVSLAIDGAGEQRVDSAGDLVFEAGAISLRQHRPRVYQEIDGQRVEVAASYRIASDRHIRLALAEYDASRPLVIDPVIQFSVYFGGGGYDVGIAIATDAGGNVYITGNTNSSPLATASSFQNQVPGGGDAFVAKFSGGNGQLVWATYLGGSGFDQGNAIAVDAQNNVYVAGATGSMNFPTQGPFRGNNAGMFNGGEYDVFVTKLAPGGDSLIYSTYIGGGANDWANAIAVDSKGSAYITGWTRSTDYPTQNPIDSMYAAMGGEDSFVTKLAPSGSTLVYSTFLGGNSRDFGTGIALDSTGGAYVVGMTSSTDLPVVNAFQTANKGGVQDGFLAKLSPGGDQMLLLTYLGGSGNEQDLRVVVDSTGIYLSGSTSSADFPTVNAAQKTIGGNTDTFIAKLTPQGNSLIYSTYLGGSGDEFQYGLAVDASGSAYVTGWTSSSFDFPQRNQTQGGYGGGASDIFLARLAPQGNAFLAAGFIGGAGADEGHAIALDPSGAVWITGRTSSPGLPGARNQYTPASTNGDPFDAFVMKITPDTSVAFASVAPGTLSFTAQPGGAMPASQTVTLTSSSGSVNFAAFAMSTGNWLSLNPTSGNSTPATFSVSVNPAGLGGGTYSGSITINVPGAANSPVIIPVTLNIANVPVILSITPATIPAGSGDTTITVAGGGFSSGASAQVNGQTVGSVFVDSSTLRVVVGSGFLASAGTLRLTVTSGGVTTQPATLTVSTNGLVVTAGGVVNSATAQNVAVAPGELITIYGSGFGPSAPIPGTIDNSGHVSTLAGNTRVLFEGTPAPITFVTNGQVNAVVPFSVAGRSSVLVQVEYQGQQSASVALAVAPSVPGIFTSDASGHGQAVAINEDGSRNSANNPAAVGSVVVLYATGSGQTNPAVTDGTISNDPNNLPQPVLPVSVKVNGLDAQVLYAGAAPGLVAGVTQLNVRIPAGVPAASAIPVVLNVGNSSSRFDVTVAVK
jgi:uncharacterized protein (TIGR03437 family)